MSRSKWKVPYVDTKLLNILKNTKENNTIFTKSRSSTIVPNFVGRIVNVYNGKSYYTLKICEKMVGYKLGEFVPTRKSFSFKKKKIRIWLKKLIPY